MMMGGLKGGEGELAADGGGAGPLAVSHSAQLEKNPTIFRAHFKSATVHS